MDREDRTSPPERLPLPPEEICPPAEEFPSPAPEAFPPPEEFEARSAAEESSAKRRKRLLALAAAALLLLTGPLARRGQQAAIPGGPEGPGGETPAVSAAPEPTAAPTPEPTPEPSPSPEPTPEPDPACEILFYNFSSTSYARLLFTRPEAFRSVELELREPILDLPAASFSFGPEDLAEGVLELPGVEVGELYWEHREEYEARNSFPEELNMHAVLVYEKDGQPVTEERDLLSSPEQGWSLRYWPSSTEESDWAFPGCFVFSTYESYTPLTLVLDRPEEVRAGTISVSFSLDGRAIEADLVRCETWREAYTIGGMAVSDPFYFARLVLPRPDWAPESGILHVEVTQYLEGYRQILVIQRDLAYSDAEEAEP